MPSAVVRIHECSRSISGEIVLHSATLMSQLVWAVVAPLRLLMLPNAHDAGVVNWTPLCMTQQNRARLRWLTYSRARMHGYATRLGLIFAYSFNMNWCRERAAAASWFQRAVFVQARPGGMFRLQLCTTTCLCAVQPHLYGT